MRRKRLFAFPCPGGSRLALYTPMRGINMSCVKGSFPGTRFPNIEAEHSLWPLGKLKGAV